MASRSRVKKPRTKGRRPDATSGRFIEGELKLQVLQMRRELMSSSQIAEKIGVSSSCVRKALIEALRELTEQVTEEAEFYRVMETEKLERWERRVTEFLDENIQWQKAAKLDGEVVMVDVDAAEIGLKAVDRLLKIQEARRSMWGIDAPKKLEIDKPTAIVPIEQLTIQLGDVVLPMLNDIISGKIVGDGTMIEDITDAQAYT